MVLSHTYLSGFILPPCKVSNSTQNENVAHIFSISESGIQHGSSHSVDFLITEQTVSGPWPEALLNLAILWFSIRTRFKHLGPGADQGLDPSSTNRHLSNKLTISKTSILKFKYKVNVHFQWVLYSLVSVNTTVQGLCYLVGNNLKYDFYSNCLFK